MLETPAFYSVLFTSIQYFSDNKVTLVRVEAMMGGGTTLVEGPAALLGEQHLDF